MELAKARSPAQSSIAAALTEGLRFASGEANAEQRLEREGLREALVQGIARLPRREALVLQLYFVEELTLEEIGDALEVGAARVCQIKKQALGRLKAKLAEDWG